MWQRHHLRNFCGPHGHFVGRQCICCGKDEIIKSVMKQKARITNAREAAEIVKRVEELVRKGESVTDKEREDHAFARILLSEIKKRKER